MTLTSPVMRHPTTRKVVAFTFDDGPNPIYTPQLLDIFREANGKATFYMIGEQIERSPDTARAVLEQGHEIGNHTYTHPDVTKLDEEARRSELLRSERIILETTGVKPATFRPPYFAFDEQAAATVAEFGYPVIGAVNGAARDWEMPGVDHIVETTRETVEPGTILIFHDGFGDRSQTVEAVRQLVRELTSEGYELVTISELLQSDQV
ncbi:polysaccharide deacetylase family protein [Cohnella xylanilytica]